MPRASEQDLGCFDVAVVGAGPVGAACALDAASRGARVAVLEAGEGWGSDCAAASAGWVCPSFAGPFVQRGELGQAMRLLTRRDSPLAIRASPRLLHWLWTLLRCSGPRTVSQTAAVLGDLANASAELHERLPRARVGTGWRGSGLLDVYATREGYEGGCARAEAQRDAGLGAEPVEPHELPARAALAGPVAGAILYPDEAVCPPSQFVRALGTAAERRGAMLLPSRRVARVAETAKGVVVHTDSERVRAETVVVCAGAWTPAVLGSHARLPIVGGRGYAVEVARSAPVVEPGHLVYLHEQRVAVTPWKDTVTFAGTLELGFSDGRPRPRRVAGIATVGRRAYPGLAWEGAKQVRAGARPCTPDGVPVVGRLGPTSKVIVAAGHAMLGITLAPITGALVGGILDGGPPESLLTPLAPRRFEAGRRQRRTALASSWTDNNAQRD